MLDVNFVRSQYPVFQRPESAAWAFFENAGGSYVPESVVDRLDAFFRWYKVQPYGPFDSSIVAGEAMDAGYQCITELLNADDDEVSIGPSTSLNCYVLARSLRPHLQPGDEVVVTNQDHEANIGCWGAFERHGCGHPTLAGRSSDGRTVGGRTQSTGEPTDADSVLQLVFEYCGDLPKHARDCGHRARCGGCGSCRWRVLRRTRLWMSNSWEPMCTFSVPTRRSARTSE